MKRLQTYILILMSLWLVASCERQALHTQSPFARIKVQADWSKSGFNTASGLEEDFVHKLTLRFFPKDGSAPFEEYLENNITQGEILVPVGEYDIIAINESPEHDNKYWEDFLNFYELGNYKKMSARTLPYNINQSGSVENGHYIPAVHDFYKINENEKFSKHSHKLAVWTLTDFKVTPQMIANSNIKTKSTENATLKVEMKQMHHKAKVIARFKNINSAYTVNTAFTGLAQQKTIHEINNCGTDKATFFFRMSNRKMEDDKIHGTLEYTLYSFGRTSDASTYKIHLDVIFVDGTRYKPKNPLVFDISDMINNTEANAVINIPELIELPVVTGDLDINDWDNDENITIF